MRHESRWAAGSGQRPERVRTAGEREGTADDQDGHVPAEAAAPVDAGEAEAAESEQDGQTGHRAVAEVSKDVFESLSRLTAD